MRELTKILPPATSDRLRNFVAVRENCGLDRLPTCSRRDRERLFCSASPVQGLMACCDRIARRSPAQSTHSKSTYSNLSHSPREATKTPINACPAPSSNSLQHDFLH